MGYKLRFVYECDFCHNVALPKCILDGQFRVLPENWKNVKILGKTLCPTCYKKYAVAEKAAESAQKHFYEMGDSINDYN